MDRSREAYDPGTFYPYPSLVYPPETDGESAPFLSLNTLGPYQRGTINIPETTLCTPNTVSHGSYTAPGYVNTAVVTSMHPYMQTGYNQPRPVTNLATMENPNTTRNDQKLHSRPELDFERSSTPPPSYSWASVEHSATSWNGNGNEPACGTSIEEHSPYGSPNAKHEEFVANTSYDPTRDCYQQRLYPRKYTNNINTYKGRLDTFYDWNKEGNIPVTKEIIAKAGFYYRGNSDEVYCYECDCMLRRWKEGDDPKKEHFKFVGYNCPISL